MECVFCAIAAGKKPCAKLGESAHAIAILDVYPLVEGHSLVIPKKHHKSLAEIPREEMNDILDLVIGAEALLLENLPCEGIDLRQHYRPFVPESKLAKRHLHFHLIPRKSWDEMFKRVGKHETAMRTQPTQTQLDGLAARIRGETQDGKKQKTL